MEVVWWIAASFLMVVVCAPPQYDLWTAPIATSGASSPLHAAPEQKGAPDARRVQPVHEPPAYVDVVAW